MRKKISIMSGGVVLLLASGAAFIAARDARSPAQQAARVAPPAASVLTEAVTRGALVDRIELDANVRPALTFDVPGPASITGVTKAVLTKQPVGTGEVVRSGSLLAEISGHPLIALRGDFPTYRDLREGDQGSDVRQYQQALRQIFGSPRVTGIFDSATTRATERLYRRLGYRPPSAGTPGTPGTVNKPSASPSGSPPPPAPVSEVRLPGVEIAFIPAAEAVVLRVAKRIGMDSTGTLMTLTMGGVEVAANVPTDQVIALSDLSRGTVVHGTFGPVSTELTYLGTRQEAKTPAVTGVAGAPAEGAGQGEAPAGMIASLRPTGSTSGQLAAGVSGRVVLDIKRSPEDSQSVPVSAIFTDADGVTSVTVDPKGRRDKVPVEVLATSQGRAAVKPVGATLRDGDQVLIGYHDGTQ